ncbi:hypothetical protein, partial [Prolixibacter bellariivorans]
VVSIVRDVAVVTIVSGFQVTGFRLRFDVPLTAGPVGTGYIVAAQLCLFIYSPKRPFWIAFFGYCELPANNGKVEIP